MDTYFNCNHMETLVDLHNIAKKHNSRINFGTRSDSNCDIDEVRDYLKDDINIAEMLINENGVDILDVHSTSSALWFELIELSENKYSSLVYTVNNMSFKAIIDEPDYDVNENLVQWLDDNVYECMGNFYSFFSAPTTIRGFGFKDKISDGRVYRADMALKYFGDLVCDYFNEPRINRVY